MRQGQETRLEVQTIPTGFGRGESMCIIYIPRGQISVPADTIQRLDEWARWARPRHSLDPRGQCASAEGQHESEYPDAERGGHLMQPDLHEVLAVERVVCTKLPPVQREIVRRHFVLRNLPKEIARALGIHAYRYGEELKRGILMVRNRLTRI